MIRHLVFDMHRATSAHAWLETISLSGTIRIPLSSRR